MALIWVTRALRQRERHIQPELKITLFVCVYSQIIGAVVIYIRIILHFHLLSVFCAHSRLPNLQQRHIFAYRRCFELLFFRGISFRMAFIVPLSSLVSFRLFGRANDGSE